MNRKVEAALTLGRKYGVTPTIVEKHVAMPRMCAVTGNAYMAILVALPNGRYRLKACERLSGSKAASSSAAVMQIDASMIEDRSTDREQCPWCGSRELIHCCSCDALVCGGRTKGNLFECYDACGQKAEMAGFWTQFTGVPHSMALAQRASSLPGAQRSLPSISRALLASGKR